jgi:hypothetical protein
MSEEKKEEEPESKPLKKLVVELDLSDTHDYVFEDSINDIMIFYYNWEKGTTWEDLAPFKIISAEYEDNFDKKKIKGLIKRRLVEYYLKKANFDDSNPDSVFKEYNFLKELVKTAGDDPTVLAEATLELAHEFKSKESRKQFMKLLPKRAEDKASKAEAKEGEKEQKP